MLEFVFGSLSKTCLIRQFCFSCQFKSLAIRQSQLKHLPVGQCPPVSDNVTCQHSTLFNYYYYND